MDWKRLAIAPRRKAVATAFVYGLSLTVRFTSPTANEAPAAQGTMASIMVNNGSPTKPALPIAFRGWPLAPRSCHAACESPALTSSLPTCSPP